MADFKYETKPEGAVHDLPEKIDEAGIRAGKSKNWYNR